MTTDTRGMTEFVIRENEYAFSTYASYPATSPAADILVATATGYSYKITNVIYKATTATTFSLLQNTTTSKLPDMTYASGAHEHFMFPSPLIFATSAAIHITANATGSSVYICGYKTV